MMATITCKPLPEHEKHKDHFRTQKPRISKCGDKWACNGAIGDTPSEAYQSWEDTNSWLKSLRLRIQRDFVRVDSNL